MSAENDDNRQHATHTYCKQMYYTYNTQAYILSLYYVTDDRHSNAQRRNLQSEIHPFPTMKIVNLYDIYQNKNKFKFLWQCHVQSYRIVWFCIKYWWIYEYWKYWDESNSIKEYRVEKWQWKYSEKWNCILNGRECVKERARESDNMIGWKKQVERESRCT